MVAGVVAGACAAPESSPVSRDETLRSDLERLSRATIFFGHQSVGADILAGVASLAAREGIPLRVVETRDACGLAPGTIGHSFIGENGAPSTKVESFRRAFGGDPAQAPELALMKLCYVDFDGSTDVAALFSGYRASVEELRRLFPSTTFVHVTVPLTARQGGVKSLVKSMMGRPTSVSMNAIREKFNTLIRETYRGREPVFDLARVESTGTDGSVTTSSLGGRDVPMLIPAYTYDGSHLNEAGREHVARALVALLASLEQDSARRQVAPAGMVR
ncbi:hypothetical protein AKJ08_1859 [Vulgatibacter incomptus]|uniref:SGNH hydrolase-type esterase domain-containing protein n=2 Tax=Vulgatibacter incomptus TaxID=1391653 RepID=A0A0K1PD95_9BACT|nr:hypothetical protein AKJ08_1859 [Vulgatibacter incomptus]